MYVMLAVLSVLVLIFLCTEFSRYLEQAAEGRIPTTVLFKLVGITIPTLVSLLLPLAYFFALLLGYGRMYVDNEMIVLHACGMSRRYLLRITMQQALVLMVIVSILNFWLVPLLMRYKQQLLSGSGASIILQTIIPGQFQYVNHQKQVFYVKTVSHDHSHLAGIFMAQSSTLNQPKQIYHANHSWEFVYAKTGYQSHDRKTGEDFFTSMQGHRYFGTPGEPNFMAINYDSYALRLPGDNLRSATNNTEALPSYILLEGYKNPAYAAELQWRISLVISIVLMALLAVPLSYVHPRQGRFAKLFPAILIYLIYANMLYVARSWVAQGTVSIAIGMWWIHLLLLGLIGLLYVDFYRWRRLLKH